MTLLIDWIVTLLNWGQMTLSKEVHATPLPPPRQAPHSSLDRSTIASAASSLDWNFTFSLAPGALQECVTFSFNRNLRVLFRYLRVCFFYDLSPGRN